MSSSSIPCSEQRHLQLGQVAQRPIQTDVEHFQAGAAARTGGQGTTLALPG